LDIFAEKGTTICVEELRKVFSLFRLLIQNYNLRKVKLPVCLLSGGVKLHSFLISAMCGRFAPVVGKCSLYPLGRKFGGPQCQVGCSGGEISAWSRLKSNTGHSACSQLVYWLSCLLLFPLVCPPKVGLWDFHAGCVCLSILTFECRNQLYETLYVCRGTWAHFNGVHYKSVRSVCVFPLVVARQRLDRHILVATNTRNNSISGSVVFYTVRVVSKESLLPLFLSFSVCIPLSSLANCLVNTLPRQRGLVGGVVFYAVRVVSKESRWLVLPRTFCLYIVNLLRRRVKNFNVER
jgi:hypothetical protein